MDSEEVFVEEDLLIRPARIDDRDAILAINTDIYYGVDYLPTFIDKFLSCPNVRCYVASYKDVVVGFSAEQLVDGGHTGINRGGRVHVSMTGKGVYKRLTEYAQNQTLCKVHAFTTSNINPNMNKLPFQQQQVLLGQRDMRCYLADEKKTSELVEKTTVSVRPTRTDADLVRSFLPSPNAMSYLFPHKRIIVNWIPYRLMESNVPLMNWHDSAFYNDVIEQPNNDVTGLFSVSTTFKTKDPSYTCMLDVYGADEESLQGHIYSHLTEITNTARGSVAVIVFTERSIGRELVDSVFAGFRISRCPETRDWTKMYTQVIYEKTIATE